MSSDLSVPALGFTERVKLSTVKELMNNLTFRVLSHTIPIVMNIFTCPSIIFNRSCAPANSSACLHSTYNIYPARYIILIILKLLGEGF